MVAGARACPRGAVRACAIMAFQVRWPLLICPGSINLTQSITREGLMPRVAVTLPYFDFFPELRDELAARYPGTKFRPDRRRFEEDDLIDYLKGYEVAVIGLDRFTDKV